jgi:DUF2945 family protein
MGKRFAVGDHVTWNSEAGYVSGKIIRVHLKDVNYKGHMHLASKDDPQKSRAIRRTTSRCTRARCGIRLMAESSTDRRTLRLVRIQLD